MGLTLFLSLLAAAGTYLATRTPTESELVSSFQEAQRFYAEGAYDQAIDEYTDVSRVRSRVLAVEQVQVVVGEESFPLQEAAAYQIGNAYSKLYEEYDRFAEEARNAARRAEYRSLADTSFARAIAAFRRVIASGGNEVLTVQAHGRLIDLYFSAEAYPDVIIASREMTAAHSDDPHVIVAYYNTGWAYYETKRFARAIESFQALLSRFTSGYRADRSLFQIGECHRERGEFEEAIEAYRRLVERQRIGELTDEELLQMKREKLAGLVDETALELAAKAEIRVGTCFTSLGRFDEGLEAYQRVISLFSTERQLVEEAYLRLADLHQARGDEDAALRTYREAIDESQDRTLRARIQYALAERLFGQGDYERAIQEYRIYLQGYGDIARSAGFSEGRVRYRVGSGYQQLAQPHLQSGDAPAAASWLDLAIAQYDTLCADPASPYFLDSQFNRAVAFQALGTPAAMARARGEFEAIIDAAGDELYVQRSLGQLAELLFDFGDYQGAVERSRQLLRQFPGTDFADEAHMRIGLAHQASEQLEPAVGAFLQVAADSPFFVRSRTGAGHVLLAQRRYADAIPVLLAGLAPAEDPAQQGSLHYLLGQAYNGEAEHARAVNHFTEALARPATPRLVEALRLNRGSAALAAGDLAQGEEDLLWVVANVADPDKVRYAQDALAFSYVRRDRGTDAVRILEEMVAAAPSDEQRADLLNRMLDLYYEEESYPQTIEAARRLIALDFDDAAVARGGYGTKEKAYYLLGDALMRLNRGSEAVRTFREALRAHPNSPFALDIRLTLGAFHFAEGELDEAKALFQDLSGGDMTPEQALLVSFYLANTHYSLREFEEARTLFQRLLAGNPDARELPDILFGVAESNYQLGAFDRAIGHYRRLIDEFPGETTADDSQYNMAWCLIELDRQDEAMASFRRLLDRFPGSEYAASAQFTFGDHAYNLGRYQEAMEAYLLVQQRYPDAEITAEVPRLVAELKEAIAYERYERGIALMDSAEAGGQSEYYQQAIEVFQDVIARYPGTESEIGALSNMGVCLEELGRWQDAVGAYDRVIGMFEEERATRDAFQFAKAHRDWIVSARL